MRKSGVGKRNSARMEGLERVACCVLRDEEWSLMSIKTTFISWDFEAFNARNVRSVWLIVPRRFGATMRTEQSMALIKSRTVKHFEP